MTRRRTVLLLPGLGAQRERMHAERYGADPVFTTAMDEFFVAAGPAGVVLRGHWLTAAPNPALHDARIAQPLLFAVGHALGRSLLTYGPRPDALLGHGVGELAAACLAGVCGPRAAAALLTESSKALGETGAGLMLAVTASPRVLIPLLSEDVTVAAENGPRQTVLAGSTRAVIRQRRRLEAVGLPTRTLPTRHGFHSPVLDEAADRFERALTQVELRPPRMRMISCRTCRELRPQEAVSPRFWAGQLVLPVRYWPTLRSLLDAEGNEPGLLLLDAGLDGSLGAPALRHPAVRSGRSEVRRLDGSGERAAAHRDESRADMATTAV